MLDAILDPAEVRGRRVRLMFQDDGDSYRAKEAQEREKQRLAERAAKAATARPRKTGR